MKDTIRFTNQIIEFKEDERPIGIIGAMKTEISLLVDELKKDEDSFSTLTLYEKTFYLGNLHEHPVVLVECGIGKVNAAFTTSLLVNNFDPKCIINTGIAGSLSPTLSHLELLILNMTTYHDFDLTPLGLPNNKVPEFPKYYYSSVLLRYFFTETAKRLPLGYTSRVGNIATGDQFIANEHTRTAIVNSTSCDCVDMETTSIAQVCHLFKISFISLRCISDSANEDVDTTYLEDEASQRSSEFLLIFFRKLDQFCLSKVDSDE